MGIYSQKAGEYFLEGYNCSQAVLRAFAPLCGMSPDQAAKIASPFGGGIGRQREVCGAFCGAVLVLGILFGTPNPGLDERKEVYARTQEISRRFREAFGTLVCRELLKGHPALADSSPMPETRSEDYYRSRPCLKVIQTAAQILEDYAGEEGRIP